MRQAPNSQPKYVMCGGWRAVAVDLGLKPGDRLQMDPISQDPWRLSLVRLPDSFAARGEAGDAAVAGPRAEP